MCWLRRWLFLTRAMPERSRDVDRSSALRGLIFWRSFGVKGSIFRAGFFEVFHLPSLPFWVAHATIRVDEGAASENNMARAPHRTNGVA